MEQVTDNGRLLVASSCQIYIIDFKVLANQNGAFGEHSAIAVRGDFGRT